jgi:hypothetical protein
MATKKVPPPPDAPKIVPNEDSDALVEIGTQATFPMSSWDDFAYGVTHAGTSKKDHFVISPRPEAVPLDKLVEMRRRDGQTRALLRLFTIPILSCLKESEWVSPNDEKGDPEDEVQFANDMFNLPPQAGGMTTSKTKIVKQLLLAILEGFSVMEEVRQIPTEGPLKNKVTLRKLAHRDSRTIRFLVDSNGGFNGVKQTAYRPGGEAFSAHIPKEKCIYWACNEEENPFYGVSMFESAWYHYEVKTKLYYIAHIASQMAAVPGRIGHYPLGTSAPKRAQFQNALAQFAFNASLTLPENFTVDAFQANSGFDFVKLIDHHSHLQAKSVLMHFADNENRMVLIDNGNGDASADMYVQFLQSLMDDIAALLTTYLMPKYIDWNFGTGVYPIFRFGAVSDSTRDAIKEIFSIVVTASMLNSTPEFVRELEKKLSTRLGLDIDYEEIEKIEDEAAEQQAKAAEEEAKVAEEAMKADQDAIAKGEVPPSQQLGQKPPKPGQPEEPGGSPFGMTPDQQDALDHLVELANDLFATRPQSGIVEDILPESALNGSHA